MLRDSGSASRHLNRAPEYAYPTRGGREVVYVEAEARLVAVSAEAGPGDGELATGAPPLPGPLKNSKLASV